jgi:hypothetical protein
MNTTTTKTVLFRSALLALAMVGCSTPASDSIVTTSPASSGLGPCNGNWMLVGSPNVGGQDNSLAFVAGTSSSDVWAVGQFAPDANPNMTLSLALHFDGAAWSVVNTPNQGTHGNAFLAVATQPGAAWAVGYDIGDDFLSHSLIEAWDGSAWTIAPHPQPFDTENLYGVAAVASNDVWAVGSGRDNEDPFQTIALHFDGGAWSQVPTPSPGTTGNVLYAVVAVASNDVWAVGQQIGDVGPDQPLVEHWDGSRWSVVPAPGGGAASTQLIGVDATQGDVDVRTVGDAQDGVVSLRTFALSSESAAFSVQGTANPSAGDNRLTGVAAVNDDESWAVGSFLDGKTGGLDTLIVTGGEGGSWQPVASPNPSAAGGDNQLANVANLGGGELWAVGAFDGPNAAQTLTLHRCTK